MALYNGYTSTVAPPPSAGRPSGSGAPAPIQIDYVASPTGRAFHKCDIENRGILGPIGSGKSSACVMEIFLRAMKQEADPHGNRRTKWCVLRSTYNELVSTTIPTFREWFYEPICTYRADKPLSARIRMPLPDGTRIDCQIIFLACDRVEDAEKVRGLEITGFWINEASEFKDKKIVDDVSMRAGRFPKKWRDKDGNKVGGATWFGGILDTNAPDDEHWWYQTAEVEKPSNWKFFYQPPAVLLAPGSTPQKPIYVPNEGQNPMIPKAENVENISTGWKYYMSKTEGKSYEHIKVMLMAQYGTVSYGKPVYPEYNDMVYYAPNRTDKNGKPMDVEIYYGLPLLLGWDFGVQNSACMIAQLSTKGQLRFIQEILGESIGIRQFARDVVTPILRNSYPNMRLISTGDPAGNSRASTDESTCLSILNEEGIPTQACYTNAPVARREAIRFFLNKMNNGEPGLLVGSKCPTLRKGFIGRYCFKRSASSVRGVDYSGEVLKDIHSHIHDAAQYIAARIMQNDNTQSAARAVSEQDRYPGVGQFNQAPSMDLSLDMRGYF